MRAIVARLFLMLPGWWMYWIDNVDDIVEEWPFTGMLIASFIWYSVLRPWDQTRRPPRCPISVMLARLLMAAWVLSFFVLLVLPVLSPFRFGLLLATVLTTGYVGLSLVIHAFGHFFDFGICWRCGYGADGDSNAYYERWGDLE